MWRDSPPLETFQQVMDTESHASITTSASADCADTQ